MGWAPIRYRDFYDLPRVFITSYEGKDYLFDCPYVSKLQSLFALLNTFTLNQGVRLTVKYAHNGVLSFPVSDEQRAAAWLDIQAIVGRNKLRPGEAEMSPEDEEDFILQEIKAARAEERA